MPLSPPADRTELHHRRLDFYGYLRSDGLFEIECTLVDTKGMDVPLLGSQRIVAAGDPMHRMSIRMAVSPDLEVVAIEAVSDATPYDVCPEAVGEPADRRRHEDRLRLDVHHQAPSRRRGRLHAPGGDADRHGHRGVPDGRPVQPA